MTWCYSQQDTLCGIIAISSVPFATFTFLFSLYQLRPSSYPHTRGVHRTSRQSSVLLTFSFYGYILVTIGPNFWLTLIGTILVVLLNTLMVFQVGMCCFYYIQAVHTMHRLPSPNGLEIVFRWTGLSFVAATTLMGIVICIYPYQWPMAIPVTYGLVLLVIETVITWKYYLAIAAFALGVPQSIQEGGGSGLQGATRDRFMKLRRIIQVGTGFIFIGMLVNGYLVSQYLLYPFKKFEHALYFDTLNMVMLQGPTLLVLYLGGLPVMEGKQGEKEIGENQRKSTTPGSHKNSSGAKTTMDEDFTRSMAPSSPPPSSFSFDRPTTPPPPRYTTLRIPELHPPPSDRTSATTPTPPLSASGHSSAAMISSSFSHNNYSTPSSEGRHLRRSLGGEEELLGGDLGELTPREPVTPNNTHRPIIESLLIPRGYGVQYDLDKNNNNPPSPASSVGGATLSSPSRVVTRHLLEEEKDAYVA